MLASWCVLVACVGAVWAAPHGHKTLILESGVQGGVQEGVPFEQPQGTGFVKTVEVVSIPQASSPHHHTIDPHFRDSAFYQAMDQAGADLFKGLGNAGSALGDFLARLAGGKRK
ncbi:hypothetical protein GWK47_055073 [Chionoecetes opilio]|uniref:Uncharacterized protein n=1 Tax=Chionoecetes opilio TaxID=41210 RepID=A0A8J5CRG1_CHIOP|nr:hypothetical protein GWK47_055073 [Chionoecetes opilio]